MSAPTFQPSEALVGAFTSALYSSADAWNEYPLLVIADALTTERLTAAAAEGPWTVGSWTGRAWYVESGVCEFSVGPFDTEREAIMVCGALNLCARQAP